VTDFASLIYFIIMKQLFSFIRFGFYFTLGLSAFFNATTLSFADVKLPSIFSDHMVLQRQHQNPIWGWADVGEKVTVTIGQQVRNTVAGAEGAWKVTLDSLPTGAAMTLTVKGRNTIQIHDVLVGEVWICSGQSNMAYPVAAANDSALELLTANYPEIRIISVPQVGTQEPQKDFKGQWQACSPETVASFSAVGYFFGRNLHQALDVPIGLIDNSWGGSSAEAWVPRDLLKADSRYDALLEKWTDLENSYDAEAEKAKHQGRLEKWKAAVKKAKATGVKAPNRPRAPRNQLVGQHRPANLYNGVLLPVISYGIRGAIWYQGESNAGRAYQYRHLFPLMIQSWRDDWKQGDFPFYWVQLADFRNEKDLPAESDWAELREAQTLTMSKLSNTGEAVIIDLGEAHDIHPKNKQIVAKRLALWALAKDYGVNIVHRSPIYRSMEQKGSKIILTFDQVGGGLDTFDVRQTVGLSIAGEDRQFHWAQGKILSKNQLEVWADDVSNPVSVRYAWSDNPVCNLQNKEGLPVTPFRTDDWPGITINNHR
jgi:sialate O-acetylesterase